LLKTLLRQIAADASFRVGNKRTIVYLGDYVDRGHDSKGVIDLILEGPPVGFEQICLMGNHEAWLLNFLDDPGAGAGWLMNGGAATLASYGVAAGHGSNSMARLETARTAFDEALPTDHRAFLKNLSLMWRAGDYAFTHAGVRPGVALADQTADDLLWIRDDFLSSNEDFGAVIVHGHTIQDQPETRWNRIGIDTGAFATGRLTCLCVEGVEQRFLQT
jgi:serine/threonine protein phosphatase 1